MSGIHGEVPHLRVIRGRLAVPTLPNMAKTPASGTDDLPGDTERRARLVYWIGDTMRRRGIRSVAALAKSMEAPYSSVHRWLDPNGKAIMPMVWLGALCRALRLDPMVIALLPAIPADPLAPYVLDQDDPFVVALDATRLAKLDTEAEVAAARPVEDEPSAPPHTRAAQGAR